jgi:ATP-binding cassette, subfamily C (CFTR/MRP), member 1
MSGKDTDKSEVDSVSIHEVSPKKKAPRDEPTLFLDAGEQRMRYRKKWWQLW